MPRPAEIWVTETAVAEGGGFAVTYTFFDGERRTVRFVADRYSKAEVERVAQLLLSEKKDRPF